MRRGRSIETLLNRGEFINGVREQRALSLSLKAAVVINRKRGAKEARSGRLICNENVSLGLAGKIERERERVQIENRQSCFH